MDLTSLVAQGGGGAAVTLLFVLLAIKAGWLRTDFEVSAWRARAERAEGQVDKLLPAVEKLTDTVERSTLGVRG